MVFVDEYGTEGAIDRCWCTIIPRNVHREAKARPMRQLTAEVDATAKARSASGCCVLLSAASPGTAFALARAFWYSMTSCS
jgi:hypothetical protein